MAGPTVSVREALDTILAAVRPQPSLRVPLADAVGHVLADDVFAPCPYPPWTNAAMDGYAVRGGDVRGASRDQPVRLDVVGEVAAGADVSIHVGAGQAARIFTGAAVPEGADSVVRQEDTDRGASVVAVLSDRDAGMNVRAAGGVLVAGALALARGTRIGPRHVALLAAVGEAQPMVHRAPRVAILAGGDELVGLDDPDAIRSGRKLADVNSPALTALVREAGGVPAPLGIAGDDAAEIVAYVSGASDCDVIITAGGVSVGDHDHVREAMSMMGAVERFGRVRVRPGGPTAMAVLPDGRVWLALPGNPVSAMVTFELFGRPIIRAMCGDPVPERRWFRVVLQDAVTPDPVLDLYLRVTFEWPEDGGMPRARLTGPQGSGVLTSVVWGDGLVVVGAGGGPIRRGLAVTACAW